VQSGVQDRRFFVLDVSPHKAQDEGWFGPLYDDHHNGGLEEFLWLLQRVNLTGWHPRRLPKTSASIEQQRFSADSVSQWAEACIDADGIVGGLARTACPTRTLGKGLSMIVWASTKMTQALRPVQDVRGQSEPECAHGELFSGSVRDVRAVHAV
jgi:hypothetical protein